MLLFEKHCNKTYANVIFKMDDWKGLSDKVERLDDIVNTNNLKISWGIIGSNIQNDKKAVRWIKEKNNSGKYEFWLHGYTHSNIDLEFLNKSVEQQKMSIQLSQKQSKETYGFEFSTFGAPQNKIDSNTSIALDCFSEIKGWFFGVPYSKKIVFPRVCNIEFPFGKTNLEKFILEFENLTMSERLCVTLQGHPNIWNDPEFNEFEKIIKYLKTKNVRFILPKDLYKTNYEKFIKKYPVSYKEIYLQICNKKNDVNFQNDIKQEHIIIDQDLFIEELLISLLEFKKAFLYSDNLEDVKKTIKQFLSCIYKHNKDKKHILFLTLKFIERLYTGTFTSYNESWIENYEKYVEILNHIAKTRGTNINTSVTQQYFDLHLQAFFTYLAYDYVKNSCILIKTDMNNDQIAELFDSSNIFYGINTKI